MARQEDPASLTFAPLSPATFADLESLFGQPGCAQARGCWCIYYRYSGKPPAVEGDDGPLPRAEQHRELLRQAAAAGAFVGLLAYDGGSPVGWLSFGPREDFTKLRRSPVMRAIDDATVWSVICFVIPSPHRHRGLTAQLIGAAQEVATLRGVTLESYPVHPRSGARDDSLWFGTAGSFERAGFVEVARPRPQRSIMRWSPSPGGRPPVPRLLPS